MKFLSFVEEAVMNPTYAGYIGGRIEVWSEGPYAEREIRFFTRHVGEFEKFRDKWDNADVTDEELKKVEGVVGAYYCDPLPKQEGA